MKTTALLTFLIAGACASSAWGQAASPAAPPAPGTPPGQSVRTTTAWTVGPDSDLAQVYQLLPGGADPEETAKYREALKAYKAAESEADKSAAKTAIKDLLDAQYDKSIALYGEHLDNLEQKIAEMREQLERRKNAKGEMVELKLQTVLSEADGLGWPDHGVQNFWGFYTPGFAPSPSLMPALPGPITGQPSPVPAPAPSAR